LLGWNTIGNSLLISVATISMMSIVTESSGSNNDNSPVVIGAVLIGLGSGSESGEFNKFLEHMSFQINIYNITNELRLNIPRI